jgi:predicted nucleic acid-binding protein
VSVYLCDTSCLVALLCSWHEHHERTRREFEARAASKWQLILAAHSLVEIYAVLTRLPPPYRLRGADARSLLEANWSKTKIVHLNGPETWRVLKDTEERGVTGGQTYDALIAVSALKARVETLLTWNAKNFAAFSDKLDVVTPRFF